MTETKTLHDPHAKAKTKGWIIIKLIAVQGDGMQAPGWVTLCDLGKDREHHRWATHFFNAQDGGFHSGDYITDFDEALDNFEKRSGRYTAHHVKPEPKPAMKRTHFIAIGPGVFGRATTMKEAQANMIRENGKKPRSWRIYQCTEGTYVNDMGGFNRPASDPEAIMVWSNVEGDTVVAVEK